MRRILFDTHGKGDATRSHGAASVSLRTLLLAAFITGGFAVVEFVGGSLANSLALMSDAGHMATDAFTLAFAFFANYLSRKGADEDHSYGHARIEVLAAFVNAIFMVQLVLFILYKAFNRFQNPEIVAGASVMVIAAIGLVLNLVIAFNLSHDKENLNTRAALVHVLGDLLGSVAAIASGAIIYAGGPTWVDPLLSVAICALLCRSIWQILNETILVLLDGVPRGISYEEVGQEIAKMDGILEVHDLHIWVMNPGYNALSAHVKVADINEWPVILGNLRAILKARFGIEHLAIQPEWDQ